MAQIIINGVQVLFPYQPYNVQEEYMRKVLECLQKRLNGMLESPTGTGKTLSLLCSSLAWLESYKAQQQLLHLKNSNSNGSVFSEIKATLNNIVGMWEPASSFMMPKIIYSSRTHSQLSQAVQELKRCSYRHVKAVVLGSRDQLCLHPEVSKAPNNTTKVHMCRAKINSKSCVFYMNYEEKIASKSDYQDSSVLDIEDLVSLGKKNVVCPYYASRCLKSRSDVLFTPYNYIIDPKSRRAHGIELQGNVVIMDEAHNIEGACEESMSFQLRSLDLALCITEIDQTIKMIDDFDDKFSSPDSVAPDFTITDLSILKVMFCELEELIDKEVAEISVKDGSKPGDYMIQLFAKVELTAQKRDVVVDLLDKIILYHTTKSSGIFSSKCAGLQKFSSLISVMYSRVSTEAFRESDFLKEFATKYRMFLQYETPNKNQTAVDPWAAPVQGSKRKQSWKLDGWCFSPGLGMRDIVDRGVHCVILTSGTLSPLGPMINELAVDFPVQLENPHIIKDNQVFVGVVTCGPDGTPLNSSYQNRSNEKYISSMGRTICNFCRLVPDGFLVFFPSYSVMKSNVSYWEEHGIWQNMSGLKPLFVEPQGKDAFQESIEKYYSVIKEKDSKGGTLLAVCRGKVSEGLDFADENARAVVITGLPFPPSMDPRVKLKMSYLNSIAKETKGLYGNDWYVLQASRAVNQAIGRVIRHKDDFGAILFCDNRFKDKRIQSQLSKWIHGRIHVFDSFGPALKSLSSFYKGLDQLPKRSKPNPSLGFQMNSTIIHKANCEQKLPTSISSTKNSQETTKNIFESYKPQESAAAASTSNKSVSIFDAMEPQGKDINSAEGFEASPLAKYSISSYKSSRENSVPSTSVKPNDFKRRKLSITLRQAVESENEKTTVETWKNFLSEIKSVLGVTEQYGRFCSSVKDFKTTKNVDKFAESLKEVFSAVPNRTKYLQTASLLVNSENRERFLQLST